MPHVTIYVLQDDLDEANRLAALMLPEMPNYLKPTSVLAEAARLGMAQLRAQWDTRTTTGG